MIIHSSSSITRRLPKTFMRHRFYFLYIIFFFIFVYSHRIAERKLNARVCSFMFVFCSVNEFPLTEGSIALSNSCEGETRSFHSMTNSFSIVWATQKCRRCTNSLRHRFVLPNRLKWRKTVDKTSPVVCRAPDIVSACDEWKLTKTKRWKDTVNGIEWSLTRFSFHTERDMNGLICLPWNVLLEEKRIFFSLSKQRNHQFFWH